MLKDEPSLVLRNPSNEKQIVLTSEALPISKKAFKQFFNVLTPRAENHHQMHVCIGCSVLSNQSMGSIKFQSPDHNLLTWLKQAKVFVESDSLGTECPITIRYFTKLAPEFTHLANLHENLVNQLMLTKIKVELALKLALHLKTTQIM